MPVAAISARLVAPSGGDYASGEAAASPFPSSAISRARLQPTAVHPFFALRQRRNSRFRPGRRKVARMTSKLPPFRRLAIVATLLGAWAVIASDRVPLTLHAEELEGEPVYLAQRDVGGSGAAQAAGEHELSHLRVLTKVILYVRDNYVDPNRIQPKEMMFAALDYVEKTAAEVLVEGTPEGGTMSVNVNGKVREFDVRHVDSLWKMSFMLKD